MSEYECQARICPICIDDHEGECKVADLKKRIEQLRRRQAEFASDVFAACLEGHGEALYKRVMGVLDEYEMIKPEVSDGTQTNE